MTGSVAQARQNGCLALSRSVLALKTALWPESGPNRARISLSQATTFRTGNCPISAEIRFRNFVIVMINHDEILTWLEIGDILISSLVNKEGGGGGGDWRSAVATC